MIKIINLHDFLGKIDPMKLSLNEWNSNDDFNLSESLSKDKGIFGDTHSNIISFLSFLSINKTVFEFGTFRGRTTYNLSKYSKEVYTFDLGENITNEGYSDYKVGEIYKNYQAKNITQLIGDSTKFDFTDYYQKFDLIWLDGGHSYEVCKSDFETSLNLIIPPSKGNSIIAIDDFPTWPGVKKAVEEIATTKTLYYIPELMIILYLPYNL